MASSPDRSHFNGPIGTTADANSGGNEEEGGDGSGAAKRTSGAFRPFKWLASLPFDGEACVFPSNPPAVGVFGDGGGSEPPEASRLRVVDESADPRSGNHFLASSGNHYLLF